MPSDERQCSTEQSGKSALTIVFEIAAGRSKSLNASLSYHYTSPLALHSRRSLRRRRRATMASAIVKPIAAAGLARRALQTSSFGQTAFQSIKIRDQAIRSGQLARLARAQGQFRGYADQAPSVTLSPSPPKKPRWRVLRWTYRLLQFTLLGGVLYVGYGIYENRNPPTQLPPDPKKKTLVVLGESS